MSEIGRERLGYALRRMAADLRGERQRVEMLTRENRELRARLARLESNGDGPIDPGRPRAEAARREPADRR